MQLIRLRSVPAALAVFPGFKANFAKFFNFGIPEVGDSFLENSAEATHAFCILSTICAIFPSAFPIDIFSSILQAFVYQVCWMSNPLLAFVLLTNGRSITDLISHLRKVLTPPAFARTKFRCENVLSNIPPFSLVLRLSHGQLLLLDCGG